MNKLLSLPYLSNEYFDREVNLSYSRSTEFSAGEGIAGDLLSFKTGTILDSTEIRVRHRGQRIGTTVDELALRNQGYRHNSGKRVDHLHGLCFRQYLEELLAFGEESFLWEAYS